jgi:hypothetical protein
MAFPNRDQIRAGIQGLDVAEKKVLGGIMVVMIHNHARVKDREWIAENFTRLAVPALGVAGVGDVDDDLDRVKRFVTASLGRVLDLAYPLFALVAADMQGRMAAGESHSLEDAVERALAYFSSSAP